MPLCQPRWLGSEGVKPTSQWEIRCPLLPKWQPCAGREASLMSRSETAGPQHPRRGRIRFVVVVGLAACLTLALFLAWNWRPHRLATSVSDDAAAADSTGDPRLTFPTPYPNVCPSVQYVGDAVCNRCHAGITQSYHQHPMGRSLAPASRQAAASNTGLPCHARTAERVEHAESRYHEPLFRQGSAIGCERCHGPGELHVHRREDSAWMGGGFDETIVNPGRLEPALREAVCQQCHLQG